METSRVTPLTNLRLDREDEKKMLPCRFFANGYCHKGNRCRFYHPLNMGLGSMIRVPPLPLHFGGGHPHNEMGRQSQHQQQQGSSSRIPPLFPMSSPMSTGPRGTSSHGIMNGHPSNANHYNYSPSPPSPNYADYDVPECSSPFLCDNGPVSSPNQNTVFNHIDWSEFLAPGQVPPPPTHVPHERHSPSRKSESVCKLVTGLLMSDPPSSSSSNEDMPPEGRASRRKLTAKEELLMKVKEIAKELSEEPITPIHSLDSFFRNFQFNNFSSSVAPK